jgi:bifunctional UDP-N-acetylglucosamine pyrophosphorylase / glucosamine-1-phosphate N-acetyltransferase
MPKPSKNPTRTPRFAVAILAAGKGTRLKSRHPKVLHQVGGKPLLAHVIDAATRVFPAKDVYAIIGHEADRVRDAMHATGIGFVLQKEQRGTGHAIMAAREALRDYDHVIVLSGDAPLITSSTIEKLRDFHLQQRAAMTILTAVLDRPRGYGRIIRKRPGSAEVKGIVEERALSDSQRALKEVNAGFYGFAVKPLYENIGKLGTDNAHHEYYLTDLAATLARGKQKVAGLQAAQPHEVLGCNSRWELAEVDAELRLAKCRALTEQGVSIFMPQTCVIDSEVQVGPETVIEPFVQILGRTRIGSECRIRSYSIISDSEIGNNVTLRPGCILDQARVGSGAVLGPYCNLRPGSEIGEGAHVGNFVETKKIKLGKGSKANHLTYLGDAQIGSGVNIGAGTITCNYDGVHKHQTVIEDGAFIGSDATLVAPVKIGEGAYVAAASCITHDVAAGALALGRGRQVNKEGWARKSKDSGSKHSESGS